MLTNMLTDPIYLGVAGLTLIILMTAAIFVWKRKRNKNELDMPNMPNMEQDPLMDKPNAETTARNVGRWGDQIVGKPRIISTETMEERIERIHQQTVQMQQRARPAHIPQVPKSMLRSIHQPQVALKKVPTKKISTSVAKPDSTTNKSELIVLHVMAKEAHGFKGNDVYQSVINAGLFYGKKQIFHYHDRRNIDGAILFSLASAVNPGLIDLEQLDSFTTPGLTLFMNKQDLKNPKMALETMIAVAEQLADDLEGVVLNSKRQPWTSELEMACFADVLE
ncbi:MAG: cell division protein ZipA [Gammaproteobacteria bacterium]|nr:cell division protein ZipA [Gammaproteobacteria bacterium]